MPRLLHDRYFVYDGGRACDLVTGREIHPAHLSNVRRTLNVGGELNGPALPAIIDVLEDVREAVPRWVVADASGGAQADAIARRVAVEARRRGFVAVLVSIYAKLREQLADVLQERTLLLIGGFERGSRPARAALLQAAACCPRPHVLLTFNTPRAHQLPPAVREARVAYSVAVAGRTAVRSNLSGEDSRLADRAERACQFHRSGRHAAAERLFRDVAGGFARRGAFEPAARAQIALGRMLLERGRAESAERAFDAGARCAESAAEEGVSLDARLWQATARIDAARLTDAESLGRAALLASGQVPLRQAWAHAVLARVLLCQGRVDEAVMSHLRPRSDGSQGSVGDSVDPVIMALSDEASIAVLLAAGQFFQAGQRARLLLEATATVVDPLPRLIASMGHLRVLSATGDLDLAERSLREVLALSKEARAPLRAGWARVTWHDALRQAGREVEARKVLSCVSRLGRVAGALFRREVDERATRPHGRVASRGRPVLGAASIAPVLAVELVRGAHGEENDDVALTRLVERASVELRPVRLDLVSHGTGAPSTAITVGAGRPTRLAERVLEAGVPIVDVVEGGSEHGVPVRVGSRLLGALVARWPIDRQPQASAREVLEIAAAVAGPRLEAWQTAHRDSAQACVSVPELIGVSAEIDAVRRAIERAARAPFAVLIEGESGVGKELAARAVHQLGPRRERRFCDVNCAALPDELLESELFGHVRGAFSGAVVDKVGLFEEAHGGTLFLDEVADLSSRGQAKLLRVLQQHEVRRVGETTSRKVDVRVVAAANRDMRAEVAAQRFRLDLLYRLDVIRVRIPALRERPDDVPVLARHFWSVAAGRVGSAATLTHGVLAALASYHWPGNVRELQNVMAALAVAAPARGGVRASLLPAAIAGATRVTSCRLDEARMAFERRCVEGALARAGGSRTRAAQALGLSRQGLLKTMARLGLTGRK